MPAKLVKVTISPTVVRPWMLSQMPTTKIDSTVSVVEARVSTAQIAHHDSTGICAPSSLLDDVAQPDHLGLDAREALHQRDIAERIGGALGEVAVVALDRALPGLGLAQHQRGEQREHDAQHDQQQRQPPVQEQRQRQQHEQRNERREMLAEEAEPQPPQRIRAGQHDLHQPAGMDAAVEAERQLQDVLEIVGHHRVAAAVRQPVGMQRDSAPQTMVNSPKPTQAREQRHQIGPGRDAALGLRAGQRIDDAAEQHRLGELRGRQRHVGDGQHPAEPGLRRPSSSSTRAYRRTKFMASYQSKFMACGDQCACRRFRTNLYIDSTLCAQ